jgi:L-2-hydroxyglutarate oxidase LhgO
MDDYVSTECAIIGGGIVGLAIASELIRRGKKVAVLEKEEYLCQHSSSRNSEVIHSGIYYKANSLKAQLCIEGKERLYNYCNNRHIDHQMIGKLIVGDSESKKYLENLFENGINNGVKDLEMIEGHSLKKIEPSITAKYGILSGTTGIIDSHAFILSLEEEIESGGGYISKNSEVRIFEKLNNGWLIEVGNNDPFHLKCDFLINAAGLESTRLAKILGTEAIPETNYFIGHYYKYSGANPFNHLIYPVPDSSGLGIHTTNDLDGKLRFGPDAEPIDEPDYFFLDTEKRRKFFENSIKKYFQRFDSNLLQPDYTGIRIRLGKNHIDSDFLIRKESGSNLEGLINLMGIESPGLTSSLAIAHYVGELI